MRMMQRWSNKRNLTDLLCSKWFQSCCRHIKSFLSSICLSLSIVRNKTKVSNNELDHDLQHIYQIISILVMNGSKLEYNMHQNEIIAMISKVLLHWITKTNRHSVVYVDGRVIDYDFLFEYFSMISNVIRINEEKYPKLNDNRIHNNGMNQFSFIIQRLYCDSTLKKKSIKKKGLKKFYLSLANSNYFERKSPKKIKSIMINDSKSNFFDETKAERNDIMLKNIATKLLTLCTKGDSSAYRFFYTEISNSTKSLISNNEFITTAIQFYYYVLRIHSFSQIKKSCFVQNSLMNTYARQLIYTECLIKKKKDKRNTLRNSEQNTNINLDMSLIHYNDPFYPDTILIFRSLVSYLYDRLLVWYDHFQQFKEQNEKIVANMKAENELLKRKLDGILGKHINVKSNMNECNGTSHNDDLKAELLVDPLKKKKRRKRKRKRKNNNSSTPCENSKSCVDKGASKELVFQSRKRPKYIDHSMISEQYKETVAQLASENRRLKYEIEELEFELKTSLFSYMTLYSKYQHIEKILTESNTSKHEKKKKKKTKTHKKEKNTKKKDYIVCTSSKSCETNILNSNEISSVENKVSLNSLSADNHYTHYDFTYNNTCYKPFFKIYKTITYPKILALPNPKVNKQIPVKNKRYLYKITNSIVLTPSFELLSEWFRRVLLDAIFKNAISRSTETYYFDQFHNIQVNWYKQRPIFRNEKKYLPLNSCSLEFNFESKYKTSKDHKNNLLSPKSLNFHFSGYYQSCRWIKKPSMSVSREVMIEYNSLVNKSITEGKFLAIPLYRNTESQLKKKCNKCSQQLSFALLNRSALDLESGSQFNDSMIFSRKVKSDSIQSFQDNSLIGNKPFYYTEKKIMDSAEWNFIRPRMTKCSSLTFCDQSVPKASNQYVKNIVYTQAIQPCYSKITAIHCTHNNYLMRLISQQKNLPYTRNDLIGFSTEFSRNKISFQRIQPYPYKLKLNTAIQYGSINELIFKQTKSSPMNRSILKELYTIPRCKVYTLSIEPHYWKTSGYNFSLNFASVTSTKLKTDTKNIRQKKTTSLNVCSQKEAPIQSIQVYYSNTKRSNVVKPIISSAPINELLTTPSCGPFFTEQTNPLYDTESIFENILSYSMTGKLKHIIEMCLILRNVWNNVEKTISSSRPTTYSYPRCHSQPTNKKLYSTFSPFRKRESDAEAVKDSHLKLKSNVLPKLKNKIQDVTCSEPLPPPVLCNKINNVHEYNNTHQKQHRKREQLTLLDFFSKSSAQNKTESINTSSCGEKLSTWSSFDQDKLVLTQKQEATNNLKTFNGVKTFKFDSKLSLSFDKTTLKSKHREKYNKQQENGSNRGISVNIAIQRLLRCKYYIVKKYNPLIERFVYENLDYHNIKPKMDWFSFKLELSSNDRFIVIASDNRTQFRAKLLNGLNPHLRDITLASLPLIPSKLIHDVKAWLWLGIVNQCKKKKLQESPWNVTCIVDSYIKKYLEGHVNLGEYTKDLSELENELKTKDNDFKKYPTSIKKNIKTLCSEKKSMTQYLIENTILTPTKRNILDSLEYLVLSMKGGQKTIVVLCCCFSTFTCDDLSFIYSHSTYNSSSFGKYIKLKNERIMNNNVTKESDGQSDSSKYSNSDFVTIYDSLLKETFIIPSDFVSNDSLSYEKKDDGHYSNTVTIKAIPIERLLNLAHIMKENTQLIIVLDTGGAGMRISKNENRHKNDKIDETQDEFNFLKAPKVKSTPKILSTWMQKKYHKGGTVIIKRYVPSYTYVTADNNHRQTSTKTKGVRDIKLESVLSQIEIAYPEVSFKWDIN